MYECMCMYICIKLERGMGGWKKSIADTYMYLHRSVYVYIYPKLYKSERRKKIKQINLIILHAQTDIKYKLREYVTHNYTLLVLYDKYTLWGHYAGVRGGEDGAAGKGREGGRGFFFISLKTKKKAKWYVYVTIIHINYFDIIIRGGGELVAVGRWGYTNFFFFFLIF